MDGLRCGNKTTHLRLQEHIGDELFKFSVRASRPAKRSALSHIVIQARLEVGRFLELLVLTTV
jgi:hypothetical protein